MLLTVSARADELTLGELLSRFRDADYSLVYSTGLVDEDLHVQWSGRLSIPLLDAALAVHGLALKDIGTRRWAIVRRQVAQGAAGETDEIHPGVQTIDNIVVTASRYELLGSALPSSYVLTREQIRGTPSFAGDGLRIIHRLPGAASIGVSAKPNVRGGVDDELLVLFDGVELVEPFHLRDFQSMFSSFHPETIGQIEYFTGGFPAQYGNKLSGVLDITTQDSFDGPGGELGISAYWSTALYFTEWQDSQALFSVRRGNVDQVLDLVNPKLGDPSFHDLYARYSRQFSKGLFKVSAFSFEDDIRLAGDEERARSQVSNRYVWFEWQMKRSGGHHAKTLLSHGEVDGVRSGERVADDKAEGVLSDRQALSIVSLKHLEQIKASEQLQIDIGLALKHMKVRYDTVVDVVRGDMAAFLGQPTVIQHSFHGNVAGNVGSAFVTAKYEVLPEVTIQLGLRYDRQDYDKTDMQWSPRLALLYAPIRDWLFRLSFGRFHQPHEIHELRTTDREDSFARTQRSDHWIVAVEHEMAGNQRLELEAFYKGIDHPRPRYENLFDPYQSSGPHP